MYNDNLVVDSYLLYVNNLALMTKYYTHNIGLNLLEKGQHQTILGIDNHPLLILKETNPQTKRKATGLYHTAFLVPSAADLGGVLLHLLNTNTALIGGANHGYSEALYLQDPEDNGIEIYHDNPVEVWDVRTDGQIIGITEELDATRLIENAKITSKMPSGTKIGHIHLQVNSLANNLAFFQDILGFDLKSNLANSAYFLADGLYHHHIATNIWAGENLPLRKDSELGLGYYILKKNNLDVIKENLQKAKITFKDYGHRIQTLDPNGIKLLIEE